MIGARVNGDDVVLCVADQGPGIPEDEQALIFDKFYRGGKEQNLKGTGADCDHMKIIDAHGQSQLKSQPEKP